MKDQSKRICDQVSRILGLIENSVSPREASFFHQALVDYLDFLLSRNTLEFLETNDARSSFIAICNLLRHPTLSYVVCDWLHGVLVEVDGNMSHEVGLVVGILAPLLEPPLTWENADEAHRNNCLLSCLTRRATIWAPIQAYEDIYFCNHINDVLNPLQEDVASLNSWRTANQLPCLVVNWNEVRKRLSSLIGLELNGSEGHDEPPAQPDEAKGVNEAKGGRPL